MAKEHKGELEYGESYKRRKLQNGEIQNLESYRIMKEEMSKTTERRNTKC
jgi:hypothetical protein